MPHLFPYRTEPLVYEASFEGGIYLSLCVPTRSYLGIRICVCEERLVLPPSCPSPTRKDCPQHRAVGNWGTTLFTSCLARLSLENGNWGWEMRALPACHHPPNIGLLQGRAVEDRIYHWFLCWDSFSTPQIGCSTQLES